MLSPREIQTHFSAAVREGIRLHTRCDCCDRGGAATYGAAYRHWRMQRRYPDPGNLCAVCASLNERLLGTDAQTEH